MKERGTSRLYYTVILGVFLLSLCGAVYFYSGIPWENAPKILIMVCLLVYLQTRSVKVGSIMHFSLSSTTVHPLVFLYGPTVGMAANCLGALTDGFRNKKSWERVLFNASQMPLSALISGLIFRRFGGDPLLFSWRTLVGMGFGVTAYAFTNIPLVTSIIALVSGRSWRSVFRTVGIRAIKTSLGTGFIGAVFTLFIASYSFGGLLGFGMLLIYLSGLLQTAAEVSGEQALRHELQEELVVDQMTQTLNFRFLNDWLSDLTKEKLAVLFLDIDDLKVYNDRYGHAEGDKVLVSVAQTICKVVRPNDKVIRYGGDEFVVLLPGLEAQTALQVARRIRTKLLELPFGDPVTVSAGIAESPGDTTDKRQLLMMADQAMYAAKNTGKDRVQIWSGADEAAAH